MNVLGKTVYEDMRRMEELIRNSEVDWTIVRPSGLFDMDFVSDYELAEDHIAGRFTARSDLAAAMLAQVETSGTSARSLPSPPQRTSRAWPD